MSDFSLPGSSFTEVKKIVMSYASAKADAGLDEISALAGVHRTIVSRNNKFLSEISVIQGGQKKAVTDLGKRLGRALEHGQTEDERNEWANAIQSNEPLSSVMTTVRIKGGMTEEELAKHILYVSGQANSGSNKTGARCVQDVLVAAGLLIESDGKFAVAAPRAAQATVDIVEPPANTPSKSEESAGRIEQEKPSQASSTGRIQPNVTVNIQLQLPETKDAEVYEKLFKALKENLFAD